MDCIEIKELEVYCHHGVLKEENVLGQKFSVSIIYIPIQKWPESVMIWSSPSTMQKFPIL